jgi:hypothetical protein
MYPPLPEDATLHELQRQLPPPAAMDGPLRPEPHHLPVWLRVGLIVVGILLLVVGVAGLFLPGLQGVITILAAVALLSLVSQRADRLLRWGLGPWPQLLARVEHRRERLHDWMHRQAQALRDRWSRRRGCGPPPSS